MFFQRQNHQSASPANKHCTHYTHRHTILTASFQVNLRYGVYQGSNPFQDCTAGTDIQINNYTLTHLPTDLLQFRTSPHHLHSSDHCLLHNAGVRSFRQSPFCHAAPTIWNSLPADLTDNFNNMLLSGFKCSLKTYFYKFFIHEIVTNVFHACDSFLQTDIMMHQQLHD